MIRWIAFGDCNTGFKKAYKFDPESKKYIGTHDWKGWSDIAQKILPDTIMIPKGVSGEKFFEFWRRWQEDVILEKPNIVVLFGGITEFTGVAQNPNLKIRKVIENMAQSAKENDISIMLTTMQPFRSRNEAYFCYWSEKRQEYLLSFNEWIKDFSNKENLILIDAYKILVDPKDPTYMRKEYDHIYGYYLSVQAHEALGKEVAEHIKIFQKEREEKEK